MNELEQLKKENADLRAKIENIDSKWELASSDISSLFETQPMNLEDGSFAIDGQSCHELFSAIKSTPTQSLADIQAETVLEVARNWIINKDSDYTVRTKLIDISNKLRNTP